MRVRVRVSQLVCNAIEEKISALGVHVDGKVLEDVHVTVVLGDVGDAGALTLGPDELDSLSSNIPTNQSKLNSTIVQY